MKSLKFYIILFLAPLLGFSQDAQFSQFYANPIYLAPSFAGSVEKPRFALNYRNQWRKISNSFTTYSFSADHYFKSFNSGVGVFFYHDNAGDGSIITQDLGVAYSYKVKINREIVFQPGLKVYYHTRNVNHNLTFADQYNPENGSISGPTRESLPESKINHADFAISGLGYMENYWAGFNVDHLMTLSPVLRSDFRYTNMRVSVFGGAKYQIKKRVRDKKNEFFHGAFNYRYQSQVHQLDLGAYYNRRPVMIGVWYRGIPLANVISNPDALIFSFGFKYLDYTFSYSYDMTIGKLISRTGGSHEISLIYVVGSARPVKKRVRQLPCPEF